MKILGIHPSYENSRKFALGMRGIFLYIFCRGESHLSFYRYLTGIHILVDR